MSSEGLSSSSKPASQSSSVRHKSGKLSFLNAHPVVRMVKSHEFFGHERPPSASVASGSSSPEYSNTSSSNQLSSCKWYHSFKASSSNYNLSSVDTSSSCFSPISPRELSDPNSEPLATSNKNVLSNNNSPDSYCTSRIFDFGKGAVRTKSAGSAPKLKIGFNLRKSETCSKFYKKRKTGLEMTELSISDVNTSLCSVGFKEFDHNPKSVICLEVTDDQMRALQLVHNLELSFVVNVLVPKSKYLGRLAFRKLRKKSNTRGAAASRTESRLSFTSHISLVQEDFQVNQRDCDWKCVTAPLDKVSFTQNVNLIVAIASYSFIVVRNS